jgi:hypothetical protein
MEHNNLPKYTFVKKRYSNEKNMPKFLESLKENLESIDFDDDPNLLFHNFFNCIILNLNTHIPVTVSKMKHKKTFSNWATPGIKISRDRLFELYKSKHTGGATLRNYIIRYSTIFKSVCKIAKSNYLNDKMVKSSKPIKAVWNMIKEETGRAPGSPE